MALGPNEVITDLENYMELFDIKLSKDARKTFFDIEEFSCKCNYPSRYPLFFSKAIRNSRDIQKLIYSKSINPNLSALQLEMAYYDSIGTDMSYQKGTILYSCKHDRERHQNTAILDLAIQYCVRDERSALEVRDLLLAAMDTFEKEYREKAETDQQEWQNQQYISLIQVCGKYYDSLCVTFEELRKYLMEVKGSNKKFMLPGHIFR